MYYQNDSHCSCVGQCDYIFQRKQIWKGGHVTITVDKCWGQVSTIGYDKDQITLSSIHYDTRSVSSLACTHISTGWCTINHYFSQITSANEFFWITLDWYTPKGISHKWKKSKCIIITGWHAAQNLKERNCIDYKNVQKSFWLFFSRIRKSQKVW